MAIVDWGYDGNAGVTDRKERRKRKRYGKSIFAKLNEAYPTRYPYSLI